MTINLEQKKNTLMQHVPAIPFVSNLIANAVKVLDKATKGLDDRDVLLDKSFKLATVLAEYAENKSKESGFKGDTFYDFNIVLAGLFTYVFGLETLNISDVDTEGNSVSKLLNAVKTDLGKQDELGKFKYMQLFLADLVKNNVTAFIVAVNKVYIDVVEGNLPAASVAWLVESIRTVIKAVKAPTEARLALDKLFSLILNMKF